MGRQIKIDMVLVDVPAIADSEKETLTINILDFLETAVVDKIKVFEPRHHAR